MEPVVTAAILIGCFLLLFGLPDFRRRRLVVDERLPAKRFEVVYETPEETMDRLERWAAWRRPR